MSDRYRGELGRLLGASPPAGARGWRALFRPSFSVECLIELVDGGPLRIVSPRRQIWGWLEHAGQSRATAWVGSAIADERVEVSTGDISSLAETCAALALVPSKPRGLIIDGMPATLACASEGGWVEVEGEVSILPEDWQTLARLLVSFARGRAAREVSQNALEGVTRCIAAARVSDPTAHR